MNKATRVTQKCAWCKEEDGGPWSGMALLGARRYVHTLCEADWEKSNEKSQKAMEILNDFFAKEFKKK